MADIIHRRNDCRGCGGRDLELVFRLEPTPIGDAYVTADQVDVPQPSYPIDLYMCRQCGLAQLLDVIDPAVLYGEYIYVTASSLGLVEHFRAYADSVVERCGLAPGSLAVDIGSNDGTLLRRFQERGMRVLGIEPATHIAAQATASGIHKHLGVRGAIIGGQCHNHPGRSCAGLPGPLYGFVEPPAAAVTGW